MEKYTLQKNHHYCSPKHLRFWCCKENFEWNIAFDDQCWYEKSSIIKPGVNKLIGITFGLHQEDIFGKCKLTKWLVNSALIGWQPDFNDTTRKKIFLYYYYDRDGIEKKDPFFYVNTYQKFNLKFKISKDKVLVLINNLEYLSMDPKTRLHFGYYLEPYFGGISTSPHDMDIYIHKVEK